MKSIYSILACLFLGVTTQAAEVSSKNNERVMEFYKNFPGSDANKNGVLTVSEMKSFLESRLLSSATSANYLPLKNLLNKAPEADLNKDGVLTKTELIKFLN
jgi:EF hand